MIRKLLTVAYAVALAAVATRAYREKKAHGLYYGVPFDFRLPTVDRIKARMWNPDDTRVITPTVFGVGWTINLYRAGRDMGFIEGDADGTRV